MIRRRALVLLSAAAASLARAADEVAHVRGRLFQNPSQPPAIDTADGRHVVCEGDEETIAVLRDERLKDSDFEAVGRFVTSNRLQILPIHERALFVYRGGKKLVVTYWCPVCSIRTYSPGKCVCCQKETEFDPRDPKLSDDDPTPE
jgi:hypothetical protein